MILLKKLVLKSTGILLVAADWTDKKSVLIASGDLPDASLGSNAFNDAEIAQNQSLFIPLEDLIKENMPNLTKAMEKEPKLKAMITSPDGHIYSLPRNYQCVQL